VTKKTSIIPIFFVSLILAMFSGPFSKGLYASQPANQEDRTGDSATQNNEPATLDNITPLATATKSFTHNPNLSIIDDGYIGVGDGNDGFGADAGMVCDLIDTSGIIPKHFKVDKVSIDIGMTHTWLGDITLKLQSPEGTILALVERPQGDGGIHNTGDNGANSGLGDSSNLDGILLNFADGNVIDSELMGKDITDLQFVCTDDGNCSFSPNPDQALVVGSSVADFAAFKGQNASGNWTLCAGDGGNGDTGTVATWTLHIESSSSFAWPLFLPAIKAK